MIMKTITTTVSIFTAFEKIYMSKTQAMGKSRLTNRLIGVSALVEPSMCKQNLHKQNYSNAVGVLGTSELNIRESLCYPDSLILKDLLFIFWLPWVETLGAF